MATYFSEPEVLESREKFADSLKDLIFRGSLGKVIHWNFISGSISPDGTVTASFDSEIKNDDRKYHLKCMVTPRGEYHAYSVI